MTLKKIQNFAQTRDADAFADKIEARVNGAKLSVAAPQMQFTTAMKKTPVFA